MEPIKINSIVESITFLKATSDGSYQCKRLTETGLRKKQSKTLKPIERMIRKIVKCELAGANAYLERHDRSNKRKSNGWIRDIGKNLAKAVNTARKSAKKPKLILVR